jgi:serine/threonine protein phosphatase PrpC
MSEKPISRYCPFEALVKFIFISAFCCRYVVKKLRPDLLYVAIFDGHGGSRCAEYCAEHFQAYLAHFLAREQG